MLVHRRKLFSEEEELVHERIENCQLNIVLLVAPLAVIQESNSKLGGLTGISLEIWAQP